MGKTARRPIASELLAHYIIIMKGCAKVKCSMCQSTLWKTSANLKKHLQSKHGIHVDDTTAAESDTTKTETTQPEHEQVIDQEKDQTVVEDLVVAVQQPRVELMALPSGESAVTRSVMTMVPALYRKKLRALCDLLKTNRGAVEASESGELVVDGKTFAGTSFEQALRALYVHRFKGDLPDGMAELVATLKRIGATASHVSAPAVVRMLCPTSPSSPPAKDDVTATRGEVRELIETLHECSCKLLKLY